MIYVVLGMHKSGTTLVSQILHHSGINMGEFDDSVSYDKGNKFERQNVLALDMEIMGADDDRLLDLPGGAVPELKPEQRTRMREIIQTCRKAHPDWGFKDPRATLLYTLWAEELPEHKIIAVFRDPMQVWPRFRWQGRRGYFTNFRGAYNYLLRWYEHNIRIHDLVRAGTVDSIVLDYHELMSGPDEFKRLVDFIGRDLVDRRQPELYRSKDSNDIYIRLAGKLVPRLTGKSCPDLLAKMNSLRD